MASYTLTIVDTTGIQEYVFGSNHLPQNSGASYLVDSVTQEWMVGALPTPHNVQDISAAEPFSDQQIEDGRLAAEVIYAGGGNALILFAQHEDAITFAKKLTNRTLRSAPGLGIVIQHSQFNWQTDPLGGSAGVMQQAYDALAQRKQNHKISAPLLGLSITATDAFTGFPAVQQRDGVLLSAEAAAKIQESDNAHDRLAKAFNWHGYQIPKDFNDFGEKDESSYIAIIHVDGNGMGKRIERIRNRYPAAPDNRTYIRALRRFSLSLRNANHIAFQATIDRLTQFPNTEEGKKYFARGGQISLRPIIMGGDDVTFVTDGRLGLSLAAYYIEQLEAQRLSDQQPVYCRAGIAIVKNHYPFARGYALAEELAGSAKAYINDSVSQNAVSLSAMDWHFVTSGLLRELTKIREREYQVEAGRLLMRPIRIHDEGDWRNWPNFTGLVNTFTTNECWKEKRNKIKTLREVLREGPDAVKQFVTVYQIGNLPRIQERPDMSKQGWQGGECGYFDAIEAMDFFVSLEGGN